MQITTQAVQIGLEWDTRTGSVAIPIYQTATFRHPGWARAPALTTPAPATLPVRP